jgi:hypothetical protein
LIGLGAYRSECSYPTAGTERCMVASAMGTAGYRHRIGNFSIGGAVGVSYFDVFKTGAIPRAKIWWPAGLVDFGFIF